MFVPVFALFLMPAVFLSERAEAQWEQTEGADFAIESNPVLRFIKNHPLGCIGGGLAALLVIFALIMGPASLLDAANRTGPMRTRGLRTITPKTPKEDMGGRIGDSTDNFRDK